MTVIERALWSALDVRIALRSRRAGLTRIAEHHVVAEIVIPRFRQLLEDADGLDVFACVVHARQAPTIRFGDGAEDRLALVGTRSSRDCASNQALRVVDENTRRRSRRSANDPTAYRIGGRRPAGVQAPRIGLGEDYMAHGAGGGHPGVGKRPDDGRL